MIATEWTRKVAASTITCPVIGVKRCNFLIGAKVLQIFCYCIEGKAIPCKLFLLKHPWNGRLLNNEAYRFHVFESTNNVYHCISGNSQRGFQLRGLNRAVAKKQSLNMGPKQYDDHIVISVNSSKKLVEQPEWTIPTSTIYNLRREEKADDYDSINIVESMRLMWVNDQRYPDLLQKGGSTFKFVQQVNICPIQVVLFCNDQLRILNEEYDRFVSTASVPFFVVHLDGTGAIVSKLWGLRDMERDNTKQRMLFSIVRPVRIRDDTSKPMLIPFATYLTNDRSSQSLRYFCWKFRMSYEDFRGSWPPFDVVVVDQDWAEVNALLREFNNNLTVASYLQTTYELVVNSQPKPKHLVLVKFCCVHLFKHITQVTNKFFGGSVGKELVDVMFVHIIHSTSYKEFTELFKILINIVFGDTNQQRNTLRRIVLYEQKRDEFLAYTTNTAVDDEKIFNEREDTAKNEKIDKAIYKNSPFFKDCERILEEELRNIDTAGKEKEIEFMNLIMKHYMSIIPMISAFLVPQQETCTRNFVRFSNANAESYFSLLKEMLRRINCRIGKLPIRLDVLTKTLKGKIPLKQYT